MIKIITKILVKGKKPSQIYDWMIQLNPERAHKWHPAHVGRTHTRDHKETNDILKVGDTVQFEEQIGDLKIDYKWEIKRLEEPNLFAMKAKSPYPIYLQLSFLPTKGGTEVVHELRTGFKFIGLEKLFDWVMSKTKLTPERIKAIKQHTTEEFKNLEKIL